MSIYISCQEPDDNVVFLPHLTLFHIRSWIKYRILLDINCTTPITPAIAKLPVMMYAIKNVADEPVTRQVTVFTILLVADSFKTHTSTNLSGRNRMCCIVKSFLFNLIANITPVGNVYNIRNNLYFILTLINHI